MRINRVLSYILLFVVIAAYGCSNSDSKDDRGNPSSDGDVDLQYEHDEMELEHTELYEDGDTYIDKDMDEAWDELEEIERGDEFTTERESESSIDTDLDELESDDSMSESEGEESDVSRAVVYVVMFTHIEDNVPIGEFGSEESRNKYFLLREKLIQMAELAKSYGLKWVLQPDWKFLEAARIYETEDVMASTNGKNLFQYLRDELDVTLDPHSHEKHGYNYTDVAYLLDLLGVGGSTVIGGHIWDPDLPQFQEWDRFRNPVHGEHYPEAVWRGDILIGAGTPNHVNDPLISGVWRPKDRYNFFVDDPEGNIVAVGAWHNDVEGVRELVRLYAEGVVPANVMLTASWNILPNTITRPGGLNEIERTIMQPMANLQNEGKIVVTDFTTIVNIWRTSYGAHAFVYSPN